MEKEEADLLTPEIRMVQIPGIPGINGVELFYGSWHLLNEGLTCFTNKEYFACLVCLSASIELWLKRTLNSDDELFKLLKKAKTAKIIDNDECEALNKLREDRNAYVHFDLDKLPKFNEKKTKSVRVESNWTDEEIEKADKLNGEDAEVYPTPAHRDMLPLSWVTVSAYFHLNTITRFFLKRYPRQDLLRDSYYNFTLIKIRGLNEEKVIFHLVPEKRGKKSRLNLVKFIRSSIGI